MRRPLGDVWIGSEGREEEDEEEEGGGCVPSNSAAVGLKRWKGSENLEGINFLALSVSHKTSLATTQSKG